MENVSIPPRVRQRYDEACSLCRAKYEEIHGERPKKCSYLKKNEYCPEIMEAEKKRVSKEALSEHLEKYLEPFSRGDISYSYGYLKTHIELFSKQELLAIICAFDYSIYPKLQGRLSKEEIIDIYRDLDALVRNEFLRGSSESVPR